MPEHHSAFGARYVPGQRVGAAGPGVRLQERLGWDLVQAAAWRGRFEALRAQVEGVLGVAVPDAPGRCAAADGIEVMTVAPLRLWCLGAPGDGRLQRLAAAIDPDTGCVTRLGHSHARLRLQGPSVRRLLMQEIAIDLDAVTAGAVLRTGFHHVPVTLQCIDADPEAPTFDLYLPRSFASSSWEYLLDLATAYGYEVLERASVHEGTTEGTANERE